jgi:hypothetical protein
MSTVGSIIISADPVKRWEKYSRTLHPLGSVGPCELYFDNYKPALQAQGWFHTVSFKVYGRENLLKELYANCLGRKMEAWGYGLKQYFEGRVREVTFNLPPDRFTKSLDQIANKTWMRADYDGDGTVDRTTVLQNTNSQGKYGIVDMILAGGEVEGLNVADSAVQALMDLRAFPKPAADLGGGSGRPYVEIFCRGYLNTLSNQVYNQTANTGTQSMSAEIKDIVGTPASEAYPSLPNSALLSGMIGWWPLSEQSGTAVKNEICAEGNGVLGAGAAAPTIAVAGIGDGRSCFSFDGGDYVDIYSAWLAAHFSGAKGSLGIWVCITDAAVWADGAARLFATLDIDGANTNVVKVFKHTVNDTVRFVYRAGGTLVALSDASLAASTNWFLAGITWDKAADEVKCYLQGVQVGATQNGLGTWAGTLGATTCVLGAETTAALNPHKGLLQHPMVLANRVLTAAEWLSIYAGGDGTNAAVAATGKGEFIASLDRGPNTTSVTKELDSDRTARDLIDDMAALGDADNNRWLVQGRGRTATSVRGRRAVFKQASPVVVPPTI